MTNNSLISVILPTYNRANVISRSISSILNQTYGNFELIIVDDGSTDDTEKIINSFKDERIQYISHETNKGVASALNTGINLCKGDYISFQGSDDEWRSEKLEKEIKIFENSNSTLGVVYSGLYLFYKDKKIYFPYSDQIVKEGCIHDELIKGNFVHALSLIRRSCFKKVGNFDENLPALEDWELYLRISKYYKFKFIKEPLVLHYLSTDSLTLKLHVQIKATEKIIEKHKDDFDNNKVAKSLIYGFIGSQLCLDGSLSEGRTYLKKAIKNKPLNFQYYSAFFISYLGLKSYKKFLRLFQIFRSVVINYLL